MLYQLSYSRMSASGRNRTGKTSRSSDFKSDVFTYFTTEALCARVRAVSRARGASCLVPKYQSYIYDFKDLHPYEDVYIITCNSYYYMSCVNL